MLFSNSSAADCNRRGSFAVKFGSDGSEDTDAADRDESKLISLKIDPLRFFIDPSDQRPITSGPISVKK